MILLNKIAGVGGFEPHEIKYQQLMKIHKLISKKSLKITAVNPKVYTRRIIQREGIYNQKPLFCFELSTMEL